MQTQSSNCSEQISAFHLWLWVTVAYLLSAELAHLLSFPNHFATIWIPAGVAVAAFVRIESRRWPVILLGTFIANIVSDVFFHDKSFLLSCGFWIANSCEALPAAWMIRRFSSDYRLHKVGQVLHFVFVPCLVSTAVGATVGAAVATLAFGGDYGSKWLIWWSGNYIGMLIAFPVLSMLIDTYEQLRRRSSWTSKNILLFLSLITIQALLTDYIFGRQEGRLAYAVYPILLWLIMRFDVVGAKSGLVVLGIITIGHTAAGHGLFGKIPDITERAVTVQIFLFVSATTFFTLAATIRERSDADQNLEMSQFTIDRAGDAVFWVREDASFSYVNETATRYLGYSRQELQSMSVHDINPQFSQESWPAFWQHLKQKKSDSQESKQIRRDGTSYDCDIRMTFVQHHSEEMIVANVHDITAAKEAQRSLYQSQTALDSAADAVLWVNPKGQIFYANEMACTRLGYSSDELLKLSVADINPDLDSADVFQQLFWPLIQKHKQQSMEMHHQRKNGEIFPVEINTHIIEFEGQQFACSFIRDITDRVADQEKLDDALTRLKHAIEGGDVGLWDWNIKTSDVVFSDRYHEQLGEQPGNLTSFEDWRSLVHPDDIRPAEQIVADTITHRRPQYEATFRMMHTDGTYRSILARAQLFCDENNEPERMVGSHVDITELQVTRAKLESFVKLLGTTDGGWNWELETDLVDYSPRFRELLGFDAQRDATFPTTIEFLRDRVSPNDRNELWKKIDDHLNDEVPFEHEFRLQMKNGTYSWFRGRASALRDKNGKPVRMAGSIYDITDRKKVELELLESNLDLEQFAYVASHDLQEPLRAVSGFCQLLERRYSSKLDETGTDYIQKAVAGTARMKMLIDDLLAFSSIARETDEKEVVDLELRCRSVIDSLSVLIHDTNTDMTIDQLPAVMGYPRLLDQLFQNLISNAVKFRKPGERSVIRISAVETESCWEIQIQDNGIGIAEEHQSRIFSLFERLHRREEIPGTGIGLAICRRIVDRLGGTIDVSSSFGHGSTFTVSLPKNTVSSSNVQ